MEQRRVQLAQNHATRVRVMETARQEQLRDRHHAFEEEFQRDLEYFKTHGRTERKFILCTATRHEESHAVDSSVGRRHRSCLKL